MENKPLESYQQIYLEKKIHMKELLETKNEVEIFNNEEFGQIRTIVIDDKN